MGTSRHPQPLTSTASKSYARIVVFAERWVVDVSELIVVHHSAPIILPTAIWQNDRGRMMKICTLRVSTAKPLVITVRPR